MELSTIVSNIEALNFSIQAIDTFRAIRVRARCTVPDCGKLVFMRGRPEIVYTNEDVIAPFTEHSATHT